MLEDCDQRRLDRDPAILAALAAEMDDGTVVGASKVATLARNSSSARSPARSPVRIRARSRSIHSLRRRGSGSELNAARRAATESPGSAFGSVLASFGRPTDCIGLAGISSEV